jgi:hypothetical protein
VPFNSKGKVPTTLFTLKLTVPASVATLVLSFLQENNSKGIESNKSQFSLRINYNLVR